MGSVQAQRLKESDLPAIVLQHFGEQYPTAKHVTWEKEGPAYEAEFVLNHVETSVLYGQDGVLLQTETELPVSALPQAVRAYCAQHMPGKKIKEAARIIEPSGHTLFEAEIDGKDYLFETDGTPVSSTDTKR